jgi:hypothetical protein
MHEIKAFKRIHNDLFEKGRRQTDVRRVQVIQKREDILGHEVENKAWVIEVQERFMEAHNFGIGAALLRQITVEDEFQFKHFTVRVFDDFYGDPAPKHQIVRRPDERKSATADERANLVAVVENEVRGEEAVSVLVVGRHYCIERIDGFAAIAAARLVAKEGPGGRLLLRVLFGRGAVRGLPGRAGRVHGRTLRIAEFCEMPQIFERNRSVNFYSFTFCVFI